MRKATQRGIITKGIGGFYYIKAEDGEIHECKARGIFRKEKITPMVGDKVEIDGGSIVKIEERSSVMIRPPVANINLLLIVAAAASPSPNFTLIDKLLVYAEKQGIDACICINKTDVSECDEFFNIYRKAGYDVFCTSAKEKHGISDLEEKLKNKVTAFCGLSGVGKSTLLNILTGEKMETGDLSAKIMRGKHTTRHVELMELKVGGYVFDTPGFSSFEIMDIKAEELCGYFREFCHEGCRFRGCAHINEPDCVIREMVDKGEISQSRYESYKALYENLKNKKDWD